MDEQPKKRSWVKMGCIGLLVAVGALTGLGLVADAMMSPEEKARLAAEREAKKAEEAAAEEAEAAQAAQSEIDAAEKLTATQLWGAYQQNEVATQAALKDRAVLITGRIDQITLDFMDEPVVSLATGNQFQSVQLDFDEGDVAATAELRPGQEITALCKEVSEVAGIPMLDDCALQ